jgi:peroxiredoxin/alkylhydroperoxidase family enzyme
MKVTWITYGLSYSRESDHDFLHTKATTGGDGMESKFSVGDRIPAFELPTHEGSLRRLPSEKPAVLVFFRGQWCPYCRWELSGLQTVNRAIAETGAEIIGVSPDSPEESEELRKRLSLSFTILSDSDLAVTDAFGLRHVGGRASTGQDMPFPTTFLVSPDGTVLAKFENETYRDRPSPKDVLATVQRLLAGPTGDAAGSLAANSEAKYERRNEISEARNPEVSRLFRELQQQIYSSNVIPVEFKRELFTMTSIGAGCQHCQSHGGHFLAGLGVSLERIQALWDFEASALFNDAERAALRLARDAALVPSAVTPEHFVALRKHYSNAEIAEIMDVMCIGAFLNRWHNTLATVTDQESVDWALENLGPVGWQPGKHLGEPSEQMRPLRRELAEERR